MARASAFDCSLYYVRDPEHLIRVMSTSPSYLRTAADDKVKNLRDWGLPLGRRFRALKLWFLIREQGVAGLQARLRRDMANAQWLLARIDSAPGWRVLAPVPLQTLCVRHEPAGLAGEALDAHTQAWATASIARAQHTSPRRCSTAAGWSACPSARCPPSASTSQHCGSDANEAAASK